jgi:pheromone shutdown protein TraB
VRDLGDLYGSTPPVPINNWEELKAQCDAVINNAWDERESLSDYILRAYYENEAYHAFLCLQDYVQFPAGTYNRIVVQERDIYMVCKLIQLCQMYQIDRVVFVVGAAHLRGMAHLLRAGVIGSTIKPEEVLPHLLACEKQPIDDPKVQAEVSNYAWIGERTEE